MIFKPFCKHHWVIQGIVSATHKDSGIETYWICLRCKKCGKEKDSPQIWGEKIKITTID